MSKKGFIALGVLLLLLGVQIAYVSRGLYRLGYEELAETIRNPYWLAHRLVYDGVSTNIGWHGMVMVAQKVFGFSAYQGKYVRLVLQLLALLGAFEFSRRILGLLPALGMALVLGLSPVQLFFGQLAESFGTDFFFAVGILLLLHCERGLRRRQFAIGFCAMAGCLTYPSLLFALPSFGLYFLRKKERNAAVTGSLMVALGFLTPFVIALLYLRNPGVFISDARNSGAGVFRGGGGLTHFDLGVLFRSVGQALSDLFLTGKSYYFTSPSPDFSGILGWLAFLAIAAGTALAFVTQKRARVLIALVLLAGFLSLLIPSLSGLYPGIRRSTVFVLSLYALLFLLWHLELKPWAYGATALLLLHHLVALPGNLESVGQNAGFILEPWFYTSETPAQSVEYWTDQVVAQGKPLDCRALRFCRYGEIFAAVEEQLEKESRSFPVLAVVESTGATIQLDPQLWVTYQLPH